MTRPLALALSLLALATAAAAAPLDTVSRDLSSAAGVAWQFRPEVGEWKPIQTPGGGWRKQGYRCDAGTYRATITVPAEAAGKRVRVAFAAVNFGADVFVGPDAEHLEKVGSHVNGWMPFTVDITGKVKPGSTGILVVEVQGRRKLMRNGKYLVPEGATWYDGLEEGILRGVRLEILPRTYLDSAVVRTDVRADTLEAEVTVTNDSGAAATVHIQPKLMAAGGARFRYPAVAGADVTLAAGQTRVVTLAKVKWGLGRASYWWPNVPYRAGYRSQLHALDVTLSVGGKPVHHLTQRFGFRQFEAIGNHYYLNGIRCNLRGDNQQEADFGTDAYGTKAGFGPPSAGNPGWPKAVDNLLRCNFNVMRIHQIPATPYMLDVCDELGLMLVEESPIRGSEGGEDFGAGRANMVNMDREMVARDRNHPAVVVWSAGNETWGQRDLMLACRDAILALDPTRPIIADGVGDLGAPIVNMEHYTTGLGGSSDKGASARTDRPYGETEAIWPMDNTWQGFAWMGTATRARRLRENADIRNYVFNNAFPNYVPGEGPDTEILEKRVKNMGGDMAIHAALADPWRDPHIRLLQQSYSAVAVWDVEFDRINQRSNGAGDWPTAKPRLMAGSRVTRRLAAFNDEFAGQSVKVVWQVRATGSGGSPIAGGSQTLTIPLGEYRALDIAFEAPKATGDVTLVLAAYKDGQERYREERQVFAVVDKTTAVVPNGDYRLVNRNSGLPADLGAGTRDAGLHIIQGPATASGDQVWTVRNVGDDEVVLTNKATGLVLGVEAAGQDGTPAMLQKPDGSARQVWRLREESPGWYSLLNKATGKALDVFHRATTPGGEIVQYEPNGGDNQVWQVR